jgi:hypothetical protein
MKAYLVVLAVLVACGPGGRKDGTGDDDDSPPDASNTGSNGSNGDNCSEAAKLVYVVDENNTLATFDPMTKQFHDLGTLNCPASGGATPFSMGIDRNATAYVLYSDSELFKVDTMTLACTKTSYAVQFGLAQFGMGFSTDTAGGTTDTLYIAGGQGVGATTSTLATLDTTTFKATSLGTVTGWPELTGTGNAELWGFFPDANAPRVEKLSKANGGAMTTYPENSIRGEPSAWAFAFWGGDYWVFLMKDLEFSTTVYQIDGATGAVKGQTPTGSRTIVGAGVSTCAPVVIGKPAP